MGGGDHVGMKPLYYAGRGGGLAFASEVGAFFAGGVVAPEADRAGLSGFFDVGYIPAPGCAFRGLRKLQAGSYLVWDEGGARVKRHWHPPVEGEEWDAEAPWRLEALLREATASHLQGDGSGVFPEWRMGFVDRGCAGAGAAGATEDVFAGAAGIAGVK